MGNSHNNNIFSKKILVLEIVQCSDYLSLIDICNVYNSLYIVPINLLYIQYKYPNYIFDFLELEEDTILPLLQKLISEYPPLNINNMLNESEEDPLSIACKKNYSKIVRLLSTINGIDLNISNNERGWTPLWISCRYGKTDCVNELINIQWIEVNKVTRFGITALQIACSIGNIDCVKLLLTHHEINVNIADNDGWTPLCSASWCGHTECVKLLVKHPEININLRNNDGRSALDCAIHNKRHEIITILFNIKLKNLIN
jgi:ankyrin repeat protein